MNRKQKDSIRLGSYNIRAGLGTDLKRDPGRTLTAIDALNLDVVVLQEADFRMGARPTALPFGALTEMTGLVPHRMMENAKSLGWHGISVLAKPDMALRDFDKFDLPGFEPRGAILAEFDTRIGPIRIVGVHLGLLRRSRRAQISHLRQIMEGRDTMPTILAGDFNEWSSRRGLGRLNDDYQIVTPGPSFPSRYPTLSLDRFVHTPDLTIDAKPVRQAARGPYPSDHLPIVGNVYRNGYIHAR